MTENREKEIYTKMWQYFDYDTSAIYDNAEQYLLWKGKTHRFDELNAMNEKEGN